MALPMLVFVVVVFDVVIVSPMLLVMAPASMFVVVTIVSVAAFSTGTTSVVFVTLVVSLLVHAEARRAALAITIVEKTARIEIAP
jgi:hypothetical protein